jgi:hypothetical protein
MVFNGLILNTVLTCFSLASIGSFSKYFIWHFLSKIWPILAWLNINCRPLNLVKRGSRPLCQLELSDQLLSLGLTVVRKKTLNQCLGGDF